MTGVDAAPRIVVLGYEGAPTQAERSLVSAADVVVGGRRHLDAFAVPPSRRFTLGPLSPAFERLSGLAEHERAVVVASGDPGFFGIVRRLGEAGLAPTVRPRAAAIATAFGRIGRSWEDAHIVSAHGRDLRRAVNVARSHAVVGIMTGPGAGIVEIAQALGTIWPRDLVLAERLGEPDERVRWFSTQEATLPAADDIREPNVVLALAPDDGFAVGVSDEPPWRLGAGAVTDPAWYETGLVDNHLGSLVAGALAVGPGDLAVLAGWGLAAPLPEVPRTGAAALAWPWPRRWDEDPDALLDPDALYLGLAGESDLATHLDLLRQALDTSPRLRTLAVTVDGTEAAQAVAHGIPQRAWTMVRVGSSEPIGPGAAALWGRPERDEARGFVPPEVLAAVAEDRPTDLRLLVAGPHETATTAEAPDRSAQPSSFDAAPGA